MTNFHTQHVQPLLVQKRILLNMRDRKRNHGQRHFAVRLVVRLSYFLIHVHKLLRFCLPAVGALHVAADLGNAGFQSVVQFLVSRASHFSFKYSFHFIDSVVGVLDHIHASFCFESELSQHAFECVFLRFHVFAAVGDGVKLEFCAS